MGKKKKRKKDKVMKLRKRAKEGFWDVCIPESPGSSKPVTVKAETEEEAIEVYKKRCGIISSRFPFKVAVHAEEVEEEVEVKEETEVEVEV